MRPPLILALETSCDETAVSIVDGDGEVLAGEISSQIALHRPFGGVVPEVASRNHIVAVRPLIESAVENAGVGLARVDAFAATTGPGLASSLLIGTTLAKALALAGGKPYIAVNHLEGHLLSPFMGTAEGIRPCVALVVSGGHTLLAEVRGFADYEVLGRTRDDAAGEAFDKVGKMLGLPYPGGPEIDKLARRGDPQAHAFPRGMLKGDAFSFSFSGLKTAVRYLLPNLESRDECTIADVAASFQQAVVDVLVHKTLAAAKTSGHRLIAVSGGVSCNSGLRAAFADACRTEGIELLMARPEWTTDNAAMIGHVAVHRFQAGAFSDLTTDVNPNLGLG